MSELYAAVRYYKTQKRKDVLKNNLTLEEAQKFCEESPTRKKRNGDFNSFVGFTKMANL